MTCDLKCISLCQVHASGGVDGDEPTLTYANFYQTLR